MLDPELLALLVCPETHQDLQEANQEEIQSLNQAIQESRLRNVAGQPLSEPIDGALIRADRLIAYPVRDEIPIMLVSEGMMIHELALGVEPKVTLHG